MTPSAPLIGDYAEIPWTGVRGEVEELVRMGVIDGGTSAEVNANDVNMRLQLLRVLVVAYRLTKKLQADSPKEAVAEVLASVVTFLRGEN